MKQAFRLKQGGLVDRSKAISFLFDGVRYEGHPGDTLAAALMANGVKLVGRSFKYHRPRGIVAAGVEEPNALVRLRTGARAEPNTRATAIELYEGLVAESQNRWPSLKFDLMAINNLLSPLFPAGFYYKTFMWPARLWPSYERVIRNAAGMGVATRQDDPDRYEKRFACCDVLVVGAGAAGLAAAGVAMRAGAKVFLVDENASLGGSLLGQGTHIDKIPATQWAHDMAASLSTNSRVTVLPRTTAFGYYDHNMVSLIERVADHVAVPGPHVPRQRLWHIRAKRVVLATGAIERPLVFGNNDLPGVMLASAIRTYANRYGVAAGRRIVLFVNNNSAYPAAFDLARFGIDVVAIVDVRRAIPAAIMEQARSLAIPVHLGSIVLRALGSGCVKGAEIALRDGGRGTSIACDVIGTAGGWAPSLHLHSQSGGKAVYDERIATFIPGPGKQAAISAGAARGVFQLREVLRDGAAAAVSACADLGLEQQAPDVVVEGDDPDLDIEAFWLAPQNLGVKAKQFVDLQDDVTVNDVALAARENFRSVEHLKRYTTLGMGTDQGKTSNINGLALMALARQEPIPVVGTTTFRPPYTPVTLGAFVGRQIGKGFSATRVSPMHQWHLDNGAVMASAGQWLRPKTYVGPGETYAQAWRRETLAVRRGVGIVDVSTLGKIDVQGPDAARFLDLVYSNRFSTLKPGRARYGLMLRDDGIVLDDGTTSRFAEDRFFMTTTTAHAGKVLSDLEFLLATAYQKLRVRVTSLTDQYAQIALAGPKSRAVLETLLPGVDVSDAALPHMGVLETSLAHVPLNVFRLSYSGEMAYELNIPAGYGTALWMRLLEAGKPLGITPYGTEAMGVMRIEKGHVAGPEIDGRTTADDLGLGKLASKAEPFIGKPLMHREGLISSERPKLVGVMSTSPGAKIIAGSAIVNEPMAAAVSLGWVSSSTYSPTLDTHIGIAFIKNGRELIGQKLTAWSPLHNYACEVVVGEPVFYDPSGEKLHG